MLKKSRKLKKKKNRLTSAAAERKPRAERDLYVNTNLTVREKFARNVHFQFYEWPFAYTLSGTYSIDTTLCTGCLRKKWRVFQLGRCRWMSRSMFILSLLDGLLQFFMRIICTNVWRSLCMWIWILGLIKIIYC